MANPFLAFNARLADLEKRVAGMVRHAPVAEVNTGEGWVRLNLGEGESGPLLSPKIPYAQMAGALKVHAPPTVGQNMTLISPAGDPRQAFALPMTWSDANASPGSGADPVITYGDVKLKVEPGGLTLTVGGVQVVISATGVFIDGGMVVHDGLNIGSSHTHGGIERGGADTNVPNP